MIVVRFDYVKLVYWFINEKIEIELKKLITEFAKFSLFDHLFKLTSLELISSNLHFRSLVVRPIVAFYRSALVNYSLI